MCVHVCAHVRACVCEFDVSEGWYGRAGCGVLVCMLMCALACVRICVHLFACLRTRVREFNVAEGRYGRAGCVFVNVCVHVCVHMCDARVECVMLSWMHACVHVSAWRMSVHVYMWVCMRRVSVHA